MNQLALCLAIIAQSGPPKWSEISLPAGRTQKAALHCYAAMKKEAQKTTVVPQGDLDNGALITDKPPKPTMTRKKQVTGNGGKPTTKRNKRKTMDDDDAEYNEAKKTKLCVEEEDVQCHDSGVDGQEHDTVGDAGEVDESASDGEILYEL